MKYCLIYFLMLVPDYDMRGYQISVTMAEKSAPRAPPAYGHGYPFFTLTFL